LSISPTKKPKFSVIANTIKKPKITFSKFMDKPASKLCTNS